MQIDHRGTNDNNEKLGQRGREGVTWPTFAVLVVKYFTYLKHTALDRLQVRLNVILFLKIIFCILCTSSLVGRESVSRPTSALPV